MPEACADNVGSDSLLAPKGMGEKNPSKKTVYFVAVGGHVKIGFTHQIESRIKQLSSHTGASLEVIGSVVGTRNLERAIHRKLQVFRVKGEWFVDCDEVRNEIRRILSGGDPPEFNSATPPYRSDDEYVQQASVNIRRLSAPWAPGETTKSAIKRVAAILGMSYWRAFDLWYGKARKLEAAEYKSIADAMTGRVS